MKKLSVLFSVLAFTIALAGAVSFAASPVRITYGFVNTIPNPDQCIAASVTCNGSGATCYKSVPEAGGAFHNIREWEPNSTTCGDLQQMDLQ